jgi:S1-C subfamily serine protease
VLVGVLLLATIFAVSGCGNSSTNTTSSTAATTTRVKAATAQPPSLPDLLARVDSGIVRMQVSGCTESGIGTGFLLGPRLIATVDHVVDGMTSIRLLKNGRSVGLGTVIGEDPARDIALVRSDHAIKGFHFTLAGRLPRLGEDVVAIGFPLGLPLTPTRGVVTGLHRAVPFAGILRRRLLQTDAAVNPGNSGGPLLSLETGEVVGLVDLLETDANGVAYAVSAQSRSR